MDLAWEENELLNLLLKDENPKNEILYKSCW
jgi:hypothetical protein